MILFHIVYDDFTTVCIGVDAENGNCHDIFSAADRYSCEDRYHRFHPGESRERYTAHPLSERKVSSINVIRTDLYRCIDGPSCVDICPCDVFYFDEAAHKSVMAYPENCQSCGQCYLNCKSRSLGMTNDMYGYPITAFRGVTTATMNRKIITMPGVVEVFTKGVLPTDPAER